MNSPNSFNWSDTLQATLNGVAHDQATALRVARRALKLTGPQGAYVENVPGHRVNPGRILSSSPNQPLQPIKISRHFILFREQWNDQDALQRLVQFAAADLAQAEDAVVLLGALAGAFLQKLNVELDQPSELDHQEGLFDKEQPESKAPILDSILEGIEHLQRRGQFGDYYAIVSPALYREAYTNRHNPLDAPVHEIRALLGQNSCPPKPATPTCNERLLCCEAAEGRRGVIFSLARGTISLAVPMDTFVDHPTYDEQRQPRFRVAEQFRLVVDDNRAKHSLK